MAMTQEEFTSLVGELEEYARQKPAGYRLRVGMLAALGYFYILLILALLLGCLGGLAYALYSGMDVNIIVVKFGWILGSLVYIIVRACWVTFPVPGGLPVTREQASRLYAMLDELSAALQCPTFHHVLITDDFNAAVAQIPRFGILGGYHSYLLLGLPLMQAMGPEQFRAVVAHEMGHLSGNHGRFGSWIYRLRAMWGRLLVQLEANQHSGSALFHRFVNWYAPFFNAYSFVLARADEYEADRCAAQLTSTPTFASALVQLNVKGRFLHEHFWPSVYKQAALQAEPPPSTFTTLSHVLQQGVLPTVEQPTLSEGASASLQNATPFSGPVMRLEDATKWLDQALARQTDTDDTHPALTDRLKSLHALPLPEPIPGLDHTESAAHYYLGTTAESLASQLDKAWREGIAPRWKDRYTRAQQARQRIVALAQKSLTEPLTPQEALERARWTAEFDSEEAAIPLLRAILEERPDDPHANFLLGGVLLEMDNEEGIAHIEKAMAQEIDSVVPGCQDIYVFLKKHRRDAEAEPYRERAQKHYAAMEMAQAERAGIKIKDSYQPHGLTREQIEDLRAQLARVPQIKAAWLVRKVVTHFPEKPLYVLGITTRRPWYRFAPEQKDRKLIKELAANLRFPGHFYIIHTSFNAVNKKIGRNLSKTEMALIYDTVKGAR